MSPAEAGLTFFHLVAKLLRDNAICRGTHLPVRSSHFSEVQADTLRVLDCDTSRLLFEDFFGVGLMAARVCTRAVSQDCPKHEKEIG